MRRLALAIVTTTVLFIGGLGLQPASAAGYPPCTITGTAANETITGTEGNDVICTGGGNDTVNALGGNDIIIVTAAGVDTINAGSGNDTIDATLGTDSTIDSGSGDDTIYGSPGDDEITAGDGADTVQGADGADLINGGLGEDNLSGDSGNDTITGDIGADSISGGDGNDTVQAGYGNDTVTGGSGDDNLSGEVGNDNLSGDTGNDTINGAAGDDIISGGDGNDQITGEADIDTITGGDGNDTVQAGYGNDTVTGGSGDDNLSGEVGNDNLSGDTGNDTITGGAGDDTISGGDGSDQITGEADIDTITGGEGDDTINAGDGDDDVDAGNGDDTVTGGGGNDDINGDAGNDTITGDTGDDNINGGGGNDTLNGTVGDDTLIGGDGLDTETGGEGNDSLQGNSGPDELYGDSGSDSLIGGEGNDVVAGGSGVDSLNGGAGLNTCDYTTNETRTTSCFYDEFAPTVNSLTFDRQNIDVSSTSQNILVTANISDATGLDFARIVCSVSGNTGYTFRAIDLTYNSGSPSAVNNIDGSGLNGFYSTGSTRNLTIQGNVSVRKGQYPGHYTCSLEVQDYAANKATRLGDFGFEVFRQGLGFDDAAPSITNIAFSKNPVESGSSAGTTRLTFEISDATSPKWGYFTCEIWSGNANHRAIELGWTKSRIFNYQSPSQGIVEGQETGTQRYSIEIPIRQGTPPGDYECDFYSDDILDNNRWFRDVATFSVTRTGTDFDESAPLLEISSDQTVVDVGDSAKDLTISLTQRDDSGSRWSYLECGRFGGEARYLHIGYVPGNVHDYTTIHTLKSWESAGDAFSFTNKITFQIPLGATPGKYVCSATILDVLGHRSDPNNVFTFTVMRTPPGLASRPTALTFEPKNAVSALLRWAEPEDKGSPNLIGYLVEYSVDSQGWLPLSGGVTTSTSLSISSLKPDSDYWFRVRAENGSTLNQDLSYVDLNWATISIHTSAPSVSQSAMNLFANNVSSSSFRLDWATPAYDGGSQITDFAVEVSRNGGQSWHSAKRDVSSSTSLTVSGAAPGTTYLVRVAAVNAVGRSEWLMGSVTTLTTTATAPKSLASSNVAGTSLSLGWGLPDSNGGAGITDYQVEVTSNGSNSWTVIPHAAFNSLGFNVTNLLPGRTYQFRVLAVTSAGVGAASNIVTVTTLGAVGPNAPASLVTSAVKTTSASLSWPGVVATQKVSNYVVDVSTDGSTWISVSKRVSTSTSLALSGLKLGTSYQVRVAAVNSVGTGAYVYGSFTTLATVSTAPTVLVSSNLSSSGFTLNWTAPSSNGGAAITDYVVEINGGGFSRSPINHDITGNTSIAVSGLNPGIKYSVRVKAVNRVGISKTSTSLYVTTLATAPGTVTGLTVKSVTATSAAITWTAPNTGGAKISDYIAEYSTDNGQTWKTVVKSASSSTSLTLKGLKTKTSYLFRVTAKNSVGYGAVSQSLTLVTP